MGRSTAIGGRDRRRYQHPRLRAPTGAARARGAWYGSPTLRLIGEPAGFFEILGELARRPRVRGPIIHDARVAAICLAHGVEKLYSRDRDFALFPELETEDPFR